MSQDIDQIIAGFKKAVEELRSIDRFLEHLDSLEASDFEGADYLKKRMFSEERSSLFDLMQVFEQEILPELEEPA